MADAFLSYSRKDKAFAVALRERLEAGGFEILLDVEDILPSEDWARRLVDMIAAADHVVFVISPDSCQSRVCSIEIETALDLSKSIIPVAFRETAAELVPEAIATRHWISCFAETEIANCVEQLAALFRTSPGWLRQHTELTTRARDWHLAPRRSALLRGGDLGRAERWLEAAGGKQPPPSALQVEFIETSRKWRRTSRAITAGVAAVAMIIAIAGWTTVEGERRLAADNERVAIAGDWMIRDPTRAGLVLLEVTDPERTPYAVASLASLLSRPLAACEMGGHPGGVRDTVVSPDGRQVLTLAEDRIARLWPATACRDRPVLELAVPGGIDQAIFTADGRRIVSIGGHAGAAMWSLDGVQEGSALDGEFESVWRMPSGDVLALRNDFSVELWGTAAALERKATFTPFANRPGFGAIARAEFAGHQLILETHGWVILAWMLGESAEASVLPGRSLLALSPDGTSYARAALVEQRGREYRRYYDVLVRPVAGGVEDLREADHDALVDAAVFSPDAGFLVTASRDGIVQVSDLREPAQRMVTRLTGHQGAIRGIRMAPSGDRFVTFGDDRTVLLWHFDSLAAPMPLQGHASPVISAAFSPDGSFLVTGSEDGVARLWSLQPGPEPRWLGTMGEVVTDAWFTPDDRLVVARSHSMRDTPLRAYVEAWPLGGNGPPIQLNEPPADIGAIARHPAEAAVALASREGAIVIRRIAPGAASRAVGSHPGVTTLAFDDAGMHLVSGADDGSLRVWDLEGGGDPVSLEIGPDEDLAAQQAAVLEDPENERLQEQLIEAALLSGARGAFRQIGMSMRARRVLAADLTSVFSWSLDEPGKSVRLNPGDRLIEGAAFDPTGRFVATAHAWDYVVRLWRADGSGLVREVGAATASIEALRFSPDGRHLVVVSKDETVRIWRTDRPDPAVVLRGHTSWVVDAAFSPDSRRLVTAAYDGGARVWKVDGSDEEIVLGHGSYAARFDSTGARVVTASGDGRVAVWSLDGRRLQSAIAGRTRICLDEQFRRRFLAEDAATAAANAARCRQDRLAR